MEIVIVNRIVSLLVAMLLAPAAMAADLSPDQEEQVKIKSMKWMENLQKAEALTKAAKYQEAEALFNQSLADRKALGLDLYTEYERLGNLYMTWGKHDEALKTYKEMVAAREKLNGADDQMVCEPLKLLAGCLDKCGKKAEAKAARDRAAAIQKEADTIPKFGKITLAPGSPARIAEGEKMRQLGEKAVKSDLQAKGLAYFEQAVALNPTDAKALCDRGEGYSWLNQFTKAKLDFDKAIKLQPNMAEAYSKRAFLHENMSHYPLAIQDFDKAIALNSKDTESMGSRAKLLDSNGKHKEAVAGYTKLIETEPALYWPYIQRAIAYTALGQHKQAIADYTTIIDRAPEDPEYYEYRGTAYIKAGDLQNALKDYDKLIQLNPKNSVGYHERAKIYEKIDGKKTPRVVSDYAMAKKLGYN